MTWFIFLIYFSQSQAGEFPCHIATKIFENLLNRSTKDPTSIFYDRERMDRISKECGVSLKDFGKKSTFLDELETMGHRMNFNRLRTEILTADPLSDLEWTIKNMENSAKKGKMNENDFKEIEKLRKIFKSRAKEKRDQDYKNFKDSCANHPVNLSNQLPPIRDQDSIGWCYAFVAADLVSAKLKKNISPFDIGLGYESEAFKSSFLNPKKIGDGGFVSMAIETGYRTGFCEEQNITPVSESIINEIGPTLSKFENFYKKTAPPELTICELYQSFKKLSKNIKVKDFEEIIKESTYSAALESLRSRACPVRSRLENEFNIQNIYFPNPNYNSMYVIQKHLLDDQPVGISVDLRSILTGTEAEKTYHHAMTIVGQERNEHNECEFIVRNSWGTSCGTFDRSRVTCLPDGTLKIHPKILDSILTGTTVIE